MKSISLTTTAKNWREIRSRNIIRLLSVVLLGLGVASLTTACGPDASCAETATCPHTGNDHDSGVDGEGRDASVDRRNAADASGSDSDRDGSMAVDARPADEARIDAPTDGTARDSSQRDSSEAGRADIGGDARTSDAPPADASLDGATATDAGEDTFDGGSGTDAGNHSDAERDAANPDIADDGGTADVTGCNATTCPTGCCDSSNKCVTTPTTAACGSGGMACQTCSVGHECNGTSCVCTEKSCTSGCCSGTKCVLFAEQTDTQCGAAKTCASCAAAMQKCDKTNGECVCNADSCPNGCCDSLQHCISYGGQNDTICGTAGAACGPCGSDKYCNGSGACSTSNWCRMQTVPSGVDLSDYQCVDFDNGVLPPAWTLTEAAGGTGQISTTQASSAPSSFYSNTGVDEQTIGTLSWSHVGVAPVTTVDLAVDVFRVAHRGDPGPTTGYHDLLCAAVGAARACLYFKGSEGFRVSFWNGTNRVDCGLVSELRMDVWTRIVLQISSNGVIDMSEDGVFQISCDSGGPGFPSSGTGSATVGIARTGMCVGQDLYFDNVVVGVYR